jgi:hypothetical protein
MKLLFHIHVISSSLRHPQPNLSEIWGTYKLQLPSVLFWVSSRIVKEKFGGKNSLRNRERAKEKRKGKGRRGESRNLVFLRTADGICVKADKAAPPEKQRSLNDVLPATTVIFLLWQTQAYLVLALWYPVVLNSHELRMPKE